MIYLYLWIYTLFLVIIWGFFAIVRIHSYKFKNFNSKIVLILRTFMTLFIILSILWYVLIFFNSSELDKKVEINTSWTNIIKEVSY